MAYNADIASIVNSDVLAIYAPQIDFKDELLTQADFWNVVGSYLKGDPAVLSKDGLCLVIGITSSEFDSYMELEQMLVRDSTVAPFQRRWKTRELEKAMMFVRAAQMAEAKKTKSNALLLAFKIEHGDEALKTSNKKKSNNNIKSEYITI